MWKRSVMIAVAAVTLTACADASAPVTPDVDVAFSSASSSGIGNIDSRRTSATTSGLNLVISWRLTGLGSNNPVQVSGHSSVERRLFCLNGSGRSVTPHYSDVTSVITSPGPFTTDNGNASGTTTITPALLPNTCPGGHTPERQNVFRSVQLNWGIGRGSVSNLSYTTARVR